LTKFQSKQNEKIMNDSKSTDLSLFLLRITFGGLMLLNHGLPKLDKLMAEGPVKFADIMGLGAANSLKLAVFAEFLCAALLVLGLFTRWAALPLVITMLIAVFMIHGADPLADKEHAILFLVPYIILMIKGAGWYSLDAQLLKK
jgi:putative oxidoreductase